MLYEVITRWNRSQKKMLKSSKEEWFWNIPIIIISKFDGKSPPSLLFSIFKHFNIKNGKLVTYSICYHSPVQDHYVTSPALSQMVFSIFTTNVKGGFTCSVTFQFTWEGRFTVFYGRKKMRNIVPCSQNNENVDLLRRDQEQKFNDYLHRQRRINPSFFNIRCHLKIDYIIFSIYLGEKKKGKPDEKQLQPLRQDLMNRRTKSPQYSRNDVITSYSIHYTKLYDEEWNAQHQLFHKDEP